METPTEKVGAWRTGHLHYTNATLRDVIADVNRYSRVPIIVADEGLFGLKLVAAFWADQIDSMIDGPPAILPVTVDRSTKGRVLVRARVEGAD
jgi:transmembrane sensor